MNTWLLDKLKSKKDDRGIAIINRDEKISYSKLWDNSELIAEFIKMNSDNKTPIIIYGNKNIEIVEVMIAALKNGKAYIPIDITFPEDRVKKIQQISKAEIIFNFSENEINIDDKDIKILNNNDLKELLKNKLCNIITENDWVTEENTCYILFTSGSTGEPKGVPISKKNIMNFVNWFNDISKINGSVALNQVSYSFDVSVIQLYLYLPNGKTLFCIDKGMISDFGELFKYLNKSNISSWVSTPSFIEMCMVYDSFNEELLPKLEKIILAGEILTKKLVRALNERFPKVEIINGYGPTEGTVLLTCCTITDKMLNDEENELPIGYLLPDADYKIERVKEKDELQLSKDVANKGELIVSSNSISNGYYNNEIETKKKFKYNKKNNNMTYKTGDIVYKIDDLLYYCGRKDFQIKLNGYRIELDDICENINKIDCVNNNIVMPVYKDGRVQYIVSFVVLKKKQEVQLKKDNIKVNLYIRKELSKLIPSYMIPKKIVIMEKFPLNVNGKIDRKELMEKYL